MLDGWADRARALRLEVHALRLACRDSRVPWSAKVLAACVVAYAVSPIDLIPDPIPVLGWLDDLVLVPLGILVVRRLIPAAVLAESRARARDARQEGGSGGWIAAAVIVAVWIATATLVGGWAWRRLTAS